MILYGLKTCDTCRKALKALPEAVFVDVRAEGVPPEIRAAAVGRFGAALVNTRSTTWRGLDDSARSLPAETLIAEHPTVMKRPLIVAGEAMWLGWSKDIATDLEGRT
ncbi:ArsC/Spx/MgsR family protein [Puniceibacterium sp. IMCC21224]|uniref:ArsC/Spx/MgsR family protein n=1 Tax=Puniceibacterium sp. IMCC21224 TaxID=1618204 RepID=UPI00064D7978|nr:ArsC/Spx/MgsR family protein [Puniceibacterium sp. IMCC21224]KMK67910.1 glutaredoxin family protein, arsenate reductase [Puniceibacterium sp. IMCC21224]